MNGVWWMAVAAALVTVAADEASDPEGLQEPGVASDYEVVVGNWTECISADEYRKKHGYPSLPVYSYNLDPNQIVREFRPQMFDQEREVKCRHINGSYVDPSMCPGIESIETSRVCIVRQDCLLGEWLPWEQRSDGSLVRRRRLLKLPQGGGKDCDVVEEVRPLVYEPDVYWVQGAWGPCRVAVEHSTTSKPSSNNDNDMEDSDAMYNDEDEDEQAEELDDKDSMQSSCGGGVQRREATCMRSNGHALEPAQCAHKPMPALVQPCEVPCPRDCEVGPWSEWGACQPTDGCPLFPVQQLTTTGYSVRRRRVISAASGGGAPCPPLEEKRTCAAPRCAAWRALPWGPCVLNQPHAACGPGRRTRELRCVGHDGKEAQRAWCSGTGAPARSERCRIACGGDCVVSAWGAWSPCSATCAAPGHPPPTRTRRRHILAPASPNGWPCPSEEQMIQQETCNTHACATYSWLATPWGPCARRTTDYVPSDNYTELSNEEPFSESYEEEPCIEEGEMTRDVMCVQNNADVVREALCAPLRRPASRRACTVRCRRGCRLGPWMPWSPCQSDCNSIDVQTRQRLVHGGPNCGTRQEERNCPRPDYCQPPRPFWVTGKWESCSVLKCGLGYTVRSIWCASGAERVDASECAGQPMPPTVARCTRSCDPDEYFKRHRYTCDNICADPIKFLDTTLRYLPNCTCDNVRLVIPPSNSSDCILPPDKECGEGRALIPAICLVGERHVPMDVCKKFHPSIDHIPGGLAYDEEFPSILRRACYVDCVRDCVVGAWGEWGPCASEEGSRAAFRFRTREVVAEARGGGRECGATLQRATCTLSQPRWVIGEWSVCKPTRSLCGPTITNRTVACVDEEGKHLDPTACELAWKGMAPAREAECRAPCPADCVVSTWSEWSPCERTKWGGRRDRTRVVLRPMAEGGMYCPPLVGGEPCAPYTYSWHVAPWDDCQPLGGSPCGEGIKKRSVRCLRSDGVFVNDSYCPNTTASEARESWCYVPCGVDCELGEWGAWDAASCLCGPTTSYMRRTRTRLTSAVWPGRACSPTEQRAPCPREPCLRPVAAPVPGCRVLSIDGKQVENACGWGVKITHARCELSGGSEDATGGAHLLPWRCAPALPGRIIIPPSEYQEEACEVKCGCKGPEAGQPGPWGAWGACRDGARSRKRQLLMPPRAACNITTRFVSIEWANCTSDADEIPDLLIVDTRDERPHRTWSNHDIYHDGYIEGGSSVLVVVWTATIVLSLYGTYMIYRGIIRCLRSRKMKSITKV